MITPLLALFFFSLIVIALFVVVLILASFLGPRQDSPTKQLPFECGAVSIGEANQQRFDIKYYLVAVAFILFEIGIVFLYPWSIAFAQLGQVGFISMLVFLSLLVIGFLFLWGRGVIDWQR